ncbi:Holliday junction resolvase RuvX [Rhizosaccharibacter radicis]|uniref:Putative pre-16S rRNA nuclease n=1 Tax=Rhizosaccharibacter radicis TaxID=2782605 RepID=A0ABT1W1K5_9PROT|nr:Holliday junction resolvase RuvX [Acetobacteraceae bacterium KSS12]
MALFNMPDLRAAIPRHHRLLGLDPGTKQIGLALSDVGLMIATPYKVLPRGKLSRDAVEIKRIADTETVGGLVVGLPLSLDGSLGPAAQAVRDWAIELSARTELPLALMDERLSSSAVNRMLISDLDMTRKRRNEVVDKIAAAYILQAALDQPASNTQPREREETDGGRNRD